MSGFSCFYPDKRLQLNVRIILGYEGVSRLCGFRSDIFILGLNRHQQSPMRAMVTRRLLTTNSSCARKLRRQLLAHL